MKTKILGVLGVVFLLSSVAFALDSYRLKQQSADYDLDMCIANYANLCIQAQCSYDLNRDCQDRCRAQSVAKCLTE